MTEPKIRFKRDDGSSFPDWEEIAFDSLYEPLNNNTYSRDCLNYESGKAKNIHYGDILVKFGEICDVQKEELPFVNDGNAVQKYVSLQDGDIVLADTAEDETVGKAIEMHNVNGENVISGLHTMACRPRLSFAPKYLGYYMNSFSYHSQLKPYMQGIKVTSIGRKNIAETMISYPSDEKEQQKIADFLSNVDEVIAASEEEVANLEQQKKAVMQKIFSQEVRFKREDGSDFPDWEESVITDIAYTYIGLVTTMTEHYVSEGVTLIRNSDIKENKFVFKEPIYLDYTFAEKNKSRKHQLGDVITVHTGDVGTSAVIDEKLVGSIGFATIVTRVKNQKEYLPKFLCWYFNSPNNKTNIENMITGDGRNNLNMKDFNKLRVPILHPDEQQLIADFLTNYDEAITAAKQELEKWKELKKGLLQQMFV